MNSTTQDDICRNLASEFGCIEDGDSPIDLALTHAVGALLARFDGRGHVASCDQRTGMSIEAVRDEFSVERDRLIIWRQVVIGRYTADILVSVWVPSQSGPLYIVVECDGHEFHERTKQQAAHDKKRDRALQRLGYPVLRFTGSEIWKSPTRAAVELIGAVLDIAMVRASN